MTKTTLDVSIVLEHRVLANRWESEQWEAVGVLPVSYTHLRAHETVLDLVCRLLLEKKKR